MGTYTKTLLKVKVLIQLFYVGKSREVDRFWNVLEHQVKIFQILKNKIIFATNETIRSLTG